MTILSIPTGIQIRSSSFGLKYNTQRFTSPLNGFTQRLNLPGAKWFASYTLASSKRANIAEVQAFLAKLRGGANSFYGYDPDGKVLLGAGGGTPLVKGASQTGSTLLIDGATAGVTNWLKMGDYFEVNGEYKMVTANINTNGSGEATITFEPPLRNSPADNAAVNITTPRCQMMLIEDDACQWAANYAGVYEISFSGVEVLS